MQAHGVLASDVVAEIASVAAHIADACELANECNTTRAMASAVIWTLDVEMVRLRVARGELSRILGLTAADMEAAESLGQLIQETAATDRGGMERQRSAAAEGTSPVSHGRRAGR